MLNKALKKLTATALALCVLLTPMSAFASFNSAFLRGLGKDFFSFFSRESIQEEQEEDDLEEYFEEDFNEPMTYVEADESSAIIYLDKSYMNLSVEKYNVFLKIWTPISFEHNGYYITLSNLKDGAFYKIRILNSKKLVGEYSFFTRPEGIDGLKLDASSKKEVKLSWANPRGLLTEIFKKNDGEENWTYITAVKENEFSDIAVEQGSGYSYKIRFVCRNAESVSFSDFAKAATFVEEDVNDIVQSHGYVIIRQNDENNRTIPYPYNDNGKTIGSSGCGVCSSLMVIRNTSSQKPTLEAYTKELLDAGCRESYGSDMIKIASYVTKNYGYSCSITKDPEVLKKHLDKGYMATAHVGANRIFSITGGHFVTVAGYIEGKKEDKAIILDPSFTLNKYNDNSRVEMGIEIQGNGIVTAPFSVLLNDCKGEYFVLFTPKK